MFLGSLEDVVLARVADYDRLVTRLLLEAEAKAAAAEGRVGTPAASRRRHPSWLPGSHSHGSAH